MNDILDFQLKNKTAIEKMSCNKKLQDLTQAWYLCADEHDYSYHFSWMGLPIIQYPQYIIAMQELIFSIQPDLIIETGIARGGSLIFYASMLKLLGGNRKVIGIDIDIRAHNRKLIEQHPMYPWIVMLEGSSISQDLIQQVYTLAKPYQNILLALDSKHTKEHVLAELEAYSPLIKPPSYIVVFDTRIEWTPKARFTNRPWGAGNSPMSAVQQFLQTNKRFLCDYSYENKLQITECPGGYLKCIS